MKVMCYLCKNNIMIEKEKYVHLEDWEKKKLLRSVWCHNNCFNKSMNKPLTQIELQAKSMLNQVQPMLTQLTGKTPVYDLK